MDIQLKELGEELGELENLVMINCTDNSLRVESYDGVTAITATKRCDVYDVHVVCGNMAYTNVTDLFGIDLNMASIGAIQHIVNYMTNGLLWKR